MRRLIDRVCLCVLLLPGMCCHLHGAEGVKSVFIKNCAPCHGNDGRARTPAARKLGVKDLTKSRISEDEIRKQILNGLVDKAGNQKMPAFKDQLTEAQVAELVKLVKELRE